MAASLKIKTTYRFINPEISSDQIGLEFSPSVQVHAQPLERGISDVPRINYFIAPSAMPLPTIKPLLQLCVIGGLQRNSITKGGGVAQTENPENIRRLFLIIIRRGSSTT